MTDKETISAQRRERYDSSNWLKARIIRNVQAAVGGTEEDLNNYEDPTGDPGLFGPDAPCWIVHGELGPMLYGGFASLMLQTLHPRAMAGVAQHSNYRNDPTGRLVRTARFVAGTTYGPMPFVEQLFAEVMGVHAHVHGSTNEGQPYSAYDPDLVTWVHITEVRQFLRSYLRYGPQHISREQQERYYREIAVIPFRLGATKVPQSIAEVEEYFSSMQPTLRATPEAIDAVRFLRKTTLSTGQSRLSSLANRISHAIVVGAAIDLLPDYARRELGLHRFSHLKAPPRRISADLLGRVLRWALGPSMVVIVSAERITRGQADATAG
jgi:uncharacterized protein (DUF2236 family)